MAKAHSSGNIRKKRARKEKGQWLRFFLKLFGWSLLGLVFLCVATGLGAYMYLSENLPKIATLKDYRPDTITTVFASDGRKIGEFYEERRVVIPLEQMPKMLVEAFIAAEDSRFYKHQGIDFFSIVRAFFKNLEAGTIVQGGSTITQQVTKSFLLTPERSYTRKIKEAILAYRIDKTFNKDEILYLYLNQIYLGHGAHGVQAAAENYFAKSVSELNLAECAILAGLPQAPSRYSPFRHPERARQRQIYVLNRMVEEHYITNTQASEAINTKLDIKARRNWYIEKVPYYTEYVRQYVEKRYGAHALFNDGLQIHTVVDLDMQSIAREEINRGLTALDKRIGYRGAQQNLKPEEIEPFSNKLIEEREGRLLSAGQTVTGVVIDVADDNQSVSVRMGNELGILRLEEMRWARKPNPEVAYYQARVTKPSQVLKQGDVILVNLKEKISETELWSLALEQVPLVQAALLCLDNETGQVQAMVGGRDFLKTQFNRATQSRRQPGSAFKPVVYAAALDKGYTPASVIIDSPFVFEDKTHDFIWKPRNYKGRFYGPTLLRKALAKSMNVVTVKILRDIGVDYVIEYAHKLGIESPIPRDLSIALGSSGLSLLEIVQAYSVFANQGYLVEPIFISKVLDRDGNVLEENKVQRTKVIEKNTAYIMTSLLESVVKEGTGQRVRALNRPAAGKTGTTNNLHDAWFVGFTPRYVTGVWVGFDEEQDMGNGETGSRAASPIWLGFMQRILADKTVRVFQVPEGVVFAKIDAQTGLLPNQDSPKTIFECFKEGTIPTEYSPRQDVVTDRDQFYKSGF